MLQENWRIPQKLLVLVTCLPLSRPSALPHQIHRNDLWAATAGMFSLSICQAKQRSCVSFCFGSQVCSSELTHHWVIGKAQISVSKICPYNMFAVLWARMNWAICKIRPDIKVKVILKVMNRSKIWVWLRSFPYWICIWSFIKMYWNTVTWLDQNRDTRGWSHKIMIQPLCKMVYRVKAQKTYRMYHQVAEGSKKSHPSVHDRQSTTRLPELWKLEIMDTRMEVLCPVHNMVIIFPLHLFLIKKFNWMPFLGVQSTTSSHHSLW